MSAVKTPPTVAELMNLEQIICDACDGCGWTEGGTDFAVGQVCAKCEGKGALRADGLDPVRLAEWDAATGGEGRR